MVCGTYQARRRRMGGMNQAICIRGVEGAEMAFVGFWSHPACIPVIPDYTERVELNAGLKIFVRVHLRLGMNQRSRRVFDRPKSACSRFRGDAELGYLASPTKRPRVRSSRCGSELIFSERAVPRSLSRIWSGMNARPPCWLHIARASREERRLRAGHRARLARASLASIVG